MITADSENILKMFEKCSVVDTIRFFFFHIQILISSTKCVSVMFAGRDTHGDALSELIRFTTLRLGLAQQVDPDKHKNATLNKYFY